MKSFEDNLTYFWTLEAQRLNKRGKSRTFKHKELGTHLQLAIFLPGQVPHAGGLQVDQPAGDLLLPLLLQVAQHAALHEHLRDTTGSKT